MKTTLLFFCLMALFFGKKITAQTDSATIHNFNFIRQALAPLDSATRSTGTQVEKSGFERWENFWAPRIGANGSYSQMIQSTRNYYNNRFAIDRASSAFSTTSCIYASSNWQPIGNREKIEKLTIIK